MVFCGGCSSLRLHHVLYYINTSRSLYFSSFFFFFFFFLFFFILFFFFLLYFILHNFSYKSVQFCSISTWYHSWFILCTIMLEPRLIFSNSESIFFTFSLLSSDSRPRPNRLRSPTFFFLFNDFTIYIKSLISYKKRPKFNSNVRNITNFCVLITKKNNNNKNKKFIY